MGRVNPNLLRGSGQSYTVPADGMVGRWQGK